VRIAGSHPSLALELAPVRVNLIAPASVDTPLSRIACWAIRLEARRQELREKLPIGARRRPRGRRCAGRDIMSTPL